MRKDALVAALLEAGLLGLAALLGFFLHSPLIFASLGPTAYEMVEMPHRPSGKPYNVLVGHAVGMAAALVALGATHAYSAPAISVTGLPFIRVLAVAVAGFLTVVGTLLLKANQPASLSTTLLISLGMMQTRHDILSIACGVALTVAAGEPIRRYRLRADQQA